MVRVGVCIPVLLLAFSLTATYAVEPLSPALGEPISANMLKEMPLHVFADGTGLPAGHGDTVTGKQLYESQCAQCHGQQGQGGRALELVGDRSLLNSEYPDRGIAVYWPNAPTLYEYIYRSMPPENPASFSVNEMYSLVAYVLLLNELISPDTIVNADVVSHMHMPNKDGFITIGR